ncbi:unnamed protein product [Protopolystoma xenopodis]|uniref:Uncharacterized protein n=1 Tax=Protopolystoma xenopodis TaxID=117903 RepID=A0A3S5FFY9_9PLAT|nr:unnamed protein product [Protopolystoma xenopodis]
MRQNEYRIKAKRLQYNEFHPSSSGITFDIPFIISLCSVSYVHPSAHQNSIQSLSVVQEEELVNLENSATVFNVLFNLPSTIKDADSFFEFLSKRQLKQSHSLFGGLLRAMLTNKSASDVSWTGGPANGVWNHFCFNEQEEELSDSCSEHASAQSRAGQLNRSWRPKARQLMSRSFESDGLSSADFPHPLFQSISLDYTTSPSHSNEDGATESQTGQTQRSYGAWSHPTGQMAMLSKRQRSLRECNSTGLGRFDLDAIGIDDPRLKNIRKTELLVDLKQAILQVNFYANLHYADHFYALYQFVH